MVLPLLRPLQGAQTPDGILIVKDQLKEKKGMKIAKPMFL
jgi:hypothetical protein